MFTFNPEVSVGNLVAAAAAMISAAAVLAALAKERALRKKEHADRVRQSTALVVAKLDRWKQIAIQAIDQLETAATEVDGYLVSSGERLATRDMFWKQVVAARAALSKCILDEEIEVAYSNLYGYDPRIHELFVGAVSRLRHIGTLIFVQLQNRTQHDVLTVQGENGGPILSAQLGNKLRLTLAESKSLVELHMESILSEFRKAMLPLVSATDEALVSRSVAIPSSLVLPSPESLRNIVFSAPTGLESRCEAIFRSTRDSQFGSEIYDLWASGIKLPEEVVAAPKSADA